MAKPELGTKRVCPTTGRKFYDLNKDPIVSPYTGESIPKSFFEPLVKGRMAERAREKAEEEPDVAVVEDVEIVSLQEADEDTSGRKRAEPAGDVDDIEDDIVPDDDDDDDTFLADDEDSDDDVADLIEGDIKGDEEP